MSGNTLGERSLYKYTSDSGTEYKYLTDDDLAEAAGAELNDRLPDLPRSFRPRIVYCQNSEGVRKSVIIPDVENGVYSTETASNITIDGETFRTTGRRGERVSFRSNPPSGGGGDGGGGGGGGIIVP